ncbi:uncharacterized protein I206_105983 [Kwoniella pini CBS 10737]|uniref:Uncharacterized protein n=1 Tax=Kwoniella pini CBS 10737 TaxID=1296096 RepID=A0A1B9I0Q3_9TREE|nr:uncharacterized protein I206_04806 [Kwoniella pini CBS 10737]OCF49119.1 hypothetical protein I206_04806 [Kwoniella pini CBS 10737]
MPSTTLTSIIPDTASFVTQRTFSVLYILYIGLPIKIMAAVKDSIIEAVSPASPSIEKQKDSADVSSASFYPTGGDRRIDPTTKVVDTSSSSGKTLVNTPNPDRSSPKEHRRISFSAAKPLVATYNPNQPRKLFQYQYGENEADDLSDSGDEGERQINEHLLSPYRPANAEQSFESNTTSGSDIHMSTLSSSGPEIFLGPQSTPFPLRQQGIVDAHSTPLRPLMQTFVPQFRDTAPVVMKPSREHLSRRIQATPVVSSGDEYDFKSLSSWRQEQIRSTRTAKLMAGTTPRMIPTLHGPLSLPYARNPSGVDATVADESAYLSHVFGLRAAGGTTVGDIGVRAGRRVSSGTYSSGTTGSGSSGYPNSAGGRNEKSTYTDHTSYTSLRGTTHHSRPLVIRDPYQNIGIKIKGIPPKEGSAIMFTKIESTDNEDKENVNPAASNRLRRRASETSLLEPKMGEAVLGPSRSQENLRDLNTLSPIPGSPAENVSKDPYRILWSRALSDPSRDLLPGSNDGLFPKVSESVPGTSILPDLAPLQYNPETMAYEFAIPQARSSYNDLHVKTPHGDITPQVLNGAHSSPSKADTSDNWRKKEKNSDVRPTQTATVAAASSSKDGTVGAGVTPGGVMTIDSLFEKFNSSGEHSAQPNVPQNIVTPEPSGKGALSRKTSTKLSRSKAASPQGSSVNVLGESTKKLNVNAPPYSPSKSDKDTPAKKVTNSSPTVSQAKTTSPKVKTSSARGTPGAGKLLKHLVEGGENAPSPSVQSRSKGKGKRGK